MAAFEVFCRITFFFLVVISASDAFRLRARFPRPQGKDFGLHAKRQLCPFCIYETKTFRQKLDHFGFSNNGTFLQRYLVASKNWVEGGPILFYTGNEGDITWFANNTGFMWDIAGEFKAMLVFAEHRYYGKSLPFGKLSYKGPKYLGYLTSEQALADFAVLIRHIKETVPGASESPVVAIGGSYGGMLAAWFRMKYPNIVIGALAASAPILQFTGLTPCEKFYQIVTEDFRRDGGDPCVNLVKKSWNVVKDYGKTESGRKKLSSIFKLCSPLKTKDNVTQLEYWLSETWVNLAMVDYPYHASFLEPLPAWPIKETCKYLQDESLDDDKLLGAISKAVGVYYNSSGNAKCFNTSQQAVSFLGDEGWYFQACTEMVMPLCSDGVNDMFTKSEWNFDAYAKDCQNSRGVTPLEYWAEIQYGGKKLKAHSNIVFSNGALDPWAAGGVTCNISDSLIAVLIEDGAHHLDLRHKNPLDPPSVVQARNLEKYYISRWISEAKKQKKEKAKLRISDKGKFRSISIR
ncbi:lysosomal Pro-X carboxypeptidase-like [Stylophora pistillata]|uniref:Lysosomal Pro-X carboxypeptidase n=1 Tax=Stylophora pistillata TaxID=50429 RepID=A0A2B4RRS7_STYPI|nr:lysosomal Pro-X carboxypeptidase-like [Stylophora pistillata]PFX19876.1 Lysosomal Pro-X carboxypeptidase [Stylophora pistillata]